MQINYVAMWADLNEELQQRKQDGKTEISIADIEEKMKRLMTFYREVHPQ